MKISLFFLLSISLAADLIKVPQDRYASWPNLRNHPGHYPFISYLTFRNECTHIIDQSTEWFDPAAVKQGDIVYLNLWYISWFIERAHDQIPHPYILLTADVGAWFPEPSHRKLIYDPKLAAWFCRNMVFSHHPKLIQIPMGQDFALFEQETLESYKQLKSAVANKDSYEKIHLLHMSFYPRTHGDRDKIEKMFLNQPYCYSTNRQGHPDQWMNIPIHQYYAELAASYFTLSPLGLETDCVRTWEALSMGCVPIVEHSFLDPLYEDLPILILHDWDEINPAFLEKKYQDLRGKKLDKASFDYWRKKLKSTQEKVQKNDLSASQWEATLWSEKDLADLTTLVSDSLTLVYSGYLTTLRPFQLAKAIPHLWIHLRDPWLNQNTYRQLSNYWPVHNLSFGAHFDSNASYFLDLSHYRASLNIDFSTSICKVGNFRHSLKDDLRELYSGLEVGTLLCGNMAEDTYVREVLEAFGKENQVEIKKRGSFWFFRKPPFFSSTLEKILPDPYPQIYETTPLLPFNPQGGYCHHAQIEKLIREWNVKNIIDIAPRMGLSTRHFASLIPEEGKIFAVDHWLGPERVTEQSLYQQFLSNAVHERYTHKIVPIRMSSTVAAQRFHQLDIPIDLIYIDATQGFQSIYKDLLSWYPFIQGHGILCGNDWRLADVQGAILRFSKEKSLLIFHEGDFWMIQPGF